jgi:hypothetical protein
MEINLLIKAVQDVGFNQNRHNPISFYDLLKILNHYKGLKNKKDNAEAKFYGNLNNSFGPND